MEDLELTTIIPESTESTTKLTTKKSLVTNNILNVTNSISVDYNNNNNNNFNTSKHLVQNNVPQIHLPHNDNVKENLLNSSLNSDQENNEIVLNIYLRILNNGIGGGIENYNNDSNQAYNNSIEHDNDDEDSDSYDDTNDSQPDPDYNDNDLELVTESYRQKRSLISTTRKPKRTLNLPTHSNSDSISDSDSGHDLSDYSFENLHTKLKHHNREIRQATTRRPSHHYRSTSKFVFVNFKSCVPFFLDFC